MLSGRSITVVAIGVIRAEPAWFPGWWMFTRWRVGRGAVVDDDGHAVRTQRGPCRARCICRVAVGLYGETPADGLSVADACARPFSRVQPGAAAPRPVRPIAVRRCVRRHRERRHRCAQRDGQREQAHALLHRRLPARTIAPPVTSARTPTSAIGHTSWPPVSGRVALSAATAGDGEGDTRLLVGDGDGARGATTRTSSVATRRVTRFVPPNVSGSRPPACAARINQASAAGWSTPLESFT